MTQPLNLYITQQIRAQGGKITFAEFMQHALYAPHIGYYNAPNVILGPQGDFITAPELGGVFAKCLAVQCAEILHTLPQKNILEFGAGTGKLAGDLLDALTQHNIQLDNYLILELSPSLRQRQQDLIAQKYPQYRHLITWLDRLPATTIDGIFLANEVIDAMPVARFYFANDKLQEYLVCEHENMFSLVTAAPTQRLHAAFIAAKITKHISQPYSSECNLWLPAWLTSLAACLHTGAILLCDYGFPRAEYYHPQRNTGTLMCHHRHRSHSNPFVYVGLQDITAHVDFTTVAEIASECGLNLAGYTNLASFLLNCGLTEYATEAISREINTLTSPAEMGELFKVMALTKDLDLPLCGFAQNEKSYSL